MGELTAGFPPSPSTSFTPHECTSLPHQETCERLGKKEVGMFYSGTAHRQKKRGTLCRRGSPGMKNTNWVLLGTMRECLTLEDMAPTWICVRVCLCLSVSAWLPDRM